MTEKISRILVLGAGYGGMMAALRLAGRSNGLAVSITLVNAIDSFIERPRLHETATGIHLAKVSIPRMIRGTGIEFVQAWVAEIDPRGRKVRVMLGSEDRWLEYNYLVLALGSRVDCRLVSGADEYAFTLDPYGDRASDVLKAKLATAGRHDFNITVVGGGATGIEAAAQIRGTFPQSHVCLVSRGEIGAFKGERVRRHIHQALNEQSIELREHATVTQVEHAGVRVGDKLLPADFVLWAGGFAGSPLPRRAGLQVNSQEQVLVDPFLRSLSDPSIYAVGDAACPVEEPGAPWRMSLFTALVSGAQAADNIIAAVAGRQPRPLSYAWYGQAIALGPADAVGFGSYPADAPWPLILRRMLAVRIRRFFIWYLRIALEIERRIPGSFFWNGKKRYARSKEQAGKILTSP